MLWLELALILITVLLAPLADGKRKQAEDHPARDAGSVHRKNAAAVAGLVARHRRQPVDR